MAAKGTSKKASEPKKLKEKVYRLTNGRSGLSKLIKSGRDGRLLSINPETGLKDRIRHCPGEKSIFTTEQSEMALVEPIEFKFGSLVVKSEDLLTQLFLDAHPSNVANGGGTFLEIDEEKEANNMLEKEDLILDIKAEIRKVSKTDTGYDQLVIASSVVLGSIEEAEKKSLGELKSLLYRKAESNPTYFADDSGKVTMFEESDITRSFLVLKSLKNGVIRKGSNGRSILWGDTKELIVDAPMGKKVEDYFAEYLGTNEGSLVAQEIVNKS